MAILLPNHFLSSLPKKNNLPIYTGQRRRELSEWLASSSNPLPARVMVNRIWQGHFGEGFVRTANNFGIVGERPSHPELLDWLGRDDSSLKAGPSRRCIGLIMLSSAYQMSSEITPEKN